MLLVTAHVKVCHLAYDISILEILAEDVRFVNLFCSILPVAPTECDVLIVCRQHNDKEWKFKKQHAKMRKILWGRKDTLAPVVSTLRGRAPPSPRRSDASDTVVAYPGFQYCGIISHIAFHSLSLPPSNPIYYHPLTSFSLPITPSSAQ